LSAPTSQRRIVVADGHRQVLAEVVHLLQNEFDIVAAVGDGVAAVQAVGDLKPNVVVLDIEMPLLNGFEVAQQIKHMGWPTKIVFFSIHEDPDYVEHAKTLGANYVLKSRMTSDLSLAINEVLEGRIFVFRTSEILSARGEEGRQRRTRHSADRSCCKHVLISHPEAHSMLEELLLCSQQNNHYASGRSTCRAPEPRRELEPSETKNPYLSH